MSRLRSCWSFALLAAALAAQEGRLAPAPPPAGAPAPGPQFLHEFGRRGAPGSFRVLFDDRGAGIVFLQLGDHYRDAAAAHKAQPGDDDLQLLLWAGADYSFRILEQSQRMQQSRLHFPVDPGTAPWQREEPADGSVRFTLDSTTGLRLRKTFRARPDQRILELELELANAGFTGGEGDWFFELVGPGLINRSEPSLFSNPAVAIGVSGERQEWRGPQANQVQELLRIDGQELAMAGSTNRFFGAFVFPLDDVARRCVLGVDVTTGPHADDQEFGIKANSAPRTRLAMKLAAPPPEQVTKATFGVYLGPKSYRVFAERPEYARFLPIMDVDLNTTCCVVTVPGGRLMAQVLIRLLSWFQGLIGSWGIAIMMLTVLVRGCLAPLNFRMQKSMRAYGQRMQVLKPKLDEIKQRYADDPKRHQQAMLQFQREHKLMPPLGGCLPIFLTMPIYIGLFTALRTAYDLRQHGFLWAADLSQPDALFGLPFFPHNFNLLPLCWITLFLVLQLRMPLPTDPQQRQMQLITRFMPILFGVMLYNYAAGLMVYMVTSMLWTFGESAITKRILGPIDPNAAAMAPTPVM